jgi:hypothetical protein
MSSGEIGESPDSGIALYRGNQYQIFKNSEWEQFCLFVRFSSRQASSPRFEASSFKNNSQSEIRMYTSTMTQFLYPETRV